MTWHPITFTTATHKYYISGQDTLRNYNDSIAFCSSWGGSLFTNNITDRIGNTQHIYW